MTRLKIQHFVIFLTFGLSSCRDTPAVSGIAGKEIKIDAALPASDSLAQFFAPYRDHIDAILDSALAYAPYTISKSDGPYNSTAGNLLADIVLSETNPLFKARTGEEIDFVLLNHGGIRSIIPKGKVTARSAYEFMPFENSIVVAELSGKSVEALVMFLRDAGRAHPIAGLQVVLDGENKIRAIRIQGKPFDDTRTYNVATSDYLLHGGDDMVFFKDAKKVVAMDYKVRSAMIDYFKKVDTLVPMTDDRFLRLD